MLLIRRYRWARTGPGYRDELLLLTGTALELGEVRLEVVGPARVGNLLEQALICVHGRPRLAAQLLDSGQRQQRVLVEKGLRRHRLERRLVGRRRIGVVLL